MRKRLIHLFASVLLYSAFFGVHPVAASSIPNFPSCTNPSGSLIAHYDDGVHGIVGSTATYMGSDSVYQLTDESNTQCYCPPQGTGIQTNWWKVNGLSNQEIDAYKQDGWIYVPNGSLWGLADAPYLAKNSEYTCHDGSSNGGSSGGSSNGTSTGIAEAVSASAPSLLSLASTGDILRLYTFLGLGVAWLLLGIILSHRKH